MAKTAIEWDSKKNLRDNLTSFCAIYAQEMQQRYTDSQRKEIFNKLQLLLKQVPAVSDAVLHRFCMQQIKQIDKSGLFGKESTLYAILNNSMEGYLASLEQKIAEHEETLVGQDAKDLELKVSLQDNNSFKKQIEKLKSELAIAKQNNSELLVNHSKTKDDLELLKKLFKNKDTRISHLEMTLTEKEMELEKTELKLASMQASPVPVTQPANLTIPLQAQLHEVAAEKARLMQVNQHLREQIDDLSHKNSKLSAPHKDPSDTVALQAKLDSKEKALQIQSKEIAKLTGQNAELRKENQDWQDKFAVLKSFLTYLKDIFGGPTIDKHRREFNAGELKTKPQNRFHL
jgi:chromosome segregation ATPase